MDIQKQRIRELREYAKEKREALAQRQQNEIESLENLYPLNYAYLLTKTIFNRLVASISAAPSGPVWFHRLISQNGAESYCQTGNENLQLVLLRNELKNNCASCVSRDLNWIKIRGSHTIHGIYVPFYKTSLPWVGEKRNMFSFPYCARGLSRGELSNRLYLFWVSVHIT